MTEEGARITKEQLTDVPARLATHEEIIKRLQEVVSRFVN